MKNAIKRMCFGVLCVAVFAAGMSDAWAEESEAPFVMFAPIPASVGEFEVPELPGYTCGFNPDQSESWLICDTVPAVDFSIENFRTASGVLIDPGSWTEQQEALRPAAAAVDVFCYDPVVVEFAGLEVDEALLCGDSE